MRKRYSYSTDGAEVVEPTLRERIDSMLLGVRIGWKRANYDRIQAIATDLADYLPDDKVVEVIEDLYAVVAGEFGE